MLEGSSREALRARPKREHRICACALRVDSQLPEQKCLPVEQGVLQDARLKATLDVAVQKYLAADGVSSQLPLMSTLSANAQSWATSGGRARLRSAPLRGGPRRRNNATWAKSIGICRITRTHLMVSERTARP